LILYNGGNHKYQNNIFGHIAQPHYSHFILAEDHISLRNVLQNKKIAKSILSFK